MPPHVRLPTILDPLVEHALLKGSALGAREISKFY